MASTLGVAGSSPAGRTNFSSISQELSASCGAGILWLLISFCRRASDRHQADRFQSSRFSPTGPSQRRPKVSSYLIRSPRGGGLEGYKGHMPPRRAVTLPQWSNWTRYWASQQDRALWVTHRATLPRLAAAHRKARRSAAQRFFASSGLTSGQELWQL